MDDLIKTDFISIFTWLNTTGCFSYLKERPKLDVDKFTYINKDTIQNIELYMKSLRLIIDDEILSAVLIEKAKKEGKPIILTSFYELSCLVFNKANSDTYKKIKESLNALKTSVIKVQKGGQGFIFNFIDSLKFDDMDNEKGSILIRLSNEIYEFYIKKSPYLVSIDLNVYRTLTGGRIQKLLFLYLKSVNLTIPTPLTKIQEILQLQHIRPQDFKRTFSINLINALKKEGVYIKIQDDKIIYKHIKKLCQTIPQSQPPHEKQSLPFSAEEIKDIFSIKLVFKMFFCKSGIFCNCSIAFCSIALSSSLALNVRACLISKLVEGLIVFIVWLSPFKFLYFFLNTI